MSHLASERIGSGGPGGGLSFCHSVILSLLASGGIFATSGLIFGSLGPAQNADTLLWTVAGIFGAILLEFQGIGP